MFIFRTLSSFQLLGSSFVFALIGLIVLTNAQKEPSLEKIKKYQAMIDGDTKVVAIIQRSSEFALSGTIQSHSYTHRYRFSIEDVDYEGMFTSKNSYIGRDSIWVYYAKDDPSINIRDPWSVISEENNKKSSPKKIIFALVMLALGIGGCILSVWGLIKK